MDSLKIGESAGRSGKSLPPAQPVAQTATFNHEMNSMQPARGLTGRTPAAHELQSGAAMAAQLSAPPAVSITPLSVAAAGYGSARAALGIGID
ncbi:hypothetical protein SAMN06265370_11111 [Puniceibacterium sediminis]|uniref:Uncharacterized protein n=1 Tax=Puniceibacterium sediminis TaxID=1608407 RepID=A0A238XEX4_9RHOB|nr:hypothetical protein SAMN06265370_11111 [Puniceibacterium sediminis]